MIMLLRMVFDVEDVKDDLNIDVKEDFNVDVEDDVDIEDDVGVDDVFLCLG